MNKFKKLAVGALAALGLWSASADASTIYVRAGNYPYGDGSTKAEAYANTFIANSAALPGDDVRILPGTYAGADSTVLCPLNAGGAAGNGTGIIQYTGVNEAGTGLNTSGTAVINGSVRISTSYTYLRNLHITGDLVIDSTARFCRVMDCTIDGQLCLDGTDYTTVVGCTSRGRFFRMSYVHNPCKRDTIANTTFTALGPSDGSLYPVSIGHGDHAEVGDPNGVGTDSCAFMFNTYYIQGAVPPSSCPDCEWWGEYFRYSTNAHCRGEKRYVTVPANGTYIRRFRDATGNNKIDCDTLIATGAGYASFWPAVDGNVGVDFPYNNDIDSSLYHFGACGSSDGLNYRVQVNGVDLTYTTVVGREHALLATGAIASTFNHCTFVGSGLGGDQGGIVRWEYVQPPNNVAFRGAPGLTFTNNIVAQMAPYTLNEPCSPYSSYGNPGRFCVYYTQAVMDSAYDLDLQTTLKADSNAYSYWGSVSTVGDRMLLVRDPNLVTFGKPGDNQPVEARYNQIDSVSVWGSMAFKDSTLATFDAHIGALSVARSVGPVSHVDAGAVAYVEDVTTEPTVTFYPSTVNFYIGKADTANVDFTNNGSGTAYIDTNEIDPDYAVGAAEPAEANLVPEDWWVNGTLTGSSLTVTIAQTVSGSVIAGPIGNGFSFDAGAIVRIPIYFDGSAKLAPGTYHVTTVSSWPGWPADHTKTYYPPITVVIH